MNRTIPSILLILIVCSVSNAQIQNPGFEIDENPFDGFPDSWTESICNSPNRVNRPYVLNPSVEYIPDFSIQGETFVGKESKGLLSDSFLYQEVFFDVKSRIILKAWCAMNSSNGVNLSGISEIWIVPGPQPPTCEDIRTLGSLVCGTEFQDSSWQLLTGKFIAPSQPAFICLVNQWIGDGAVGTASAWDGLEFLPGEVAEAGNWELYE